MSKKKNGEQVIADLRRSLAWMDLVLATLAEGVLVVDPDARVMFANDAAGSLVSKTPVALLGLPIWDALPLYRDGAVCGSAWFKSVVVGRGVRIPKGAYSLGRDASRSVEIDAGYIPKVRQLVFVVRDVTEAKKAEEARRALVRAKAEMKERKRVTDKLIEIEQRKDEFIGMASHELKTPITSLKMFVQVLKIRGDTGAGETAGRILYRMGEQIDKLAKLVANLLDLSRIQSGKLSFEMQPFDLDALVVETVEDIRSFTEGRIIRVEGGVGAPVRGDRDRIGQVLINLVTNAIKYSPEHEPVLVRLSRRGTDAVVAAKDHGIGISKTHQKRIFERFYQVGERGTAERTYPGLGIGLYISSIILERHRGTLTVKSIKGRGSTFTFTVPLAPQS